MGSLLLRTDEVAEILGVGRTKVFELLATGELPTVRMGRAVRVPRADLETWVKSMTRSPGHREGNSEPDRLEP